ncbi:MAG TPA: VanW family protein [Candidatus Doudnabacteria bacterium]|nr:VanW family protein [Candidatus Doudnabacteria bacterium]
MQTNYSRIKYLLISGAAAGGLFLVPSIAKGNTPLPPPVPTYSEVTSFAETTTVNIPENLRNQWRGNFTIPVYSMVKAGQWSLEDYIFVEYLNHRDFQPQTKTYRYNPSAVYDWIKRASANINTEAKDPEIVIKDGFASHFVPPVIGKQVDGYQSTLKIIQSLELGQTNLEISIKTTQPTRALADLNELGIKELIGRGESKFTGSPANRRHNIRVGNNKMRGLIIKPNEEFSFNKYLGPVEASAGFLPELVIKGFETIPELGGGLCQVSSTTFRAAMHAGLPITQRRNHSYAVQYYSPQGTDATIYPGVIDLKFTNDTGNHILIWPYIVGDILYFDFYGTRDGREVKLNEPQTFNRQANGAMQASWSRTVTKNGKTETHRFSSNYKPPELFQRREEFVPNPESPEAPNPNQSEPETITPATPIIQPNDSN